MVLTDALVVSLWKSERRARWFFVAHLQGSLGAGAGYIALLVLAYDRIGSAWGATAVLLADVLPAMLLGPLLGGLIDRTSRLGVAILADVIRAVAFTGLVLVDGTVAMVLFALLAGLGTAPLPAGDVRAVAKPGGALAAGRGEWPLQRGARDGVPAGAGAGGGAAGGRLAGRGAGCQRGHLRALRVVVGTAAWAHPRERGGPGR